MSSGSNDVLDVRAALTGLEKILKTGIAASSEGSNVAHSEPAATSRPLPAEVLTSSLQSKSALTRRALVILERLNSTVLPQHLPSLQISATVYIGGYIARVISEQMKCDSCIAISTKPVTNQPLLQFTRSQDRGGLLYPSDQLLFALDTVRAFAECALKESPTLQKPLATLVQQAVPALCASNLLKCKDNFDDTHRVKLMELTSVRFLRPLLSNYAFSVTDKHDAYKYFAKKPLSRKCMKL